MDGNVQKQVETTGKQIKFVEATSKQVERTGKYMKIGQ